MAKELVYTLKANVGPALEAANKAMIRACERIEKLEAELAEERAKVKAYESHFIVAALDDPTDSPDSVLKAYAESVEPLRFIPCTAYFHAREKYARPQQCSLDARHTGGHSLG